MRPGTHLLTHWFSLLFEDSSAELSSNFFQRERDGNHSQFALQPLQNQVVPIWDQVHLVH